MLVNLSMRRYWQRNLAMTAVLLGIWGLVSFGLPFFAPALNHYALGAFPLGFYLMAQGVPLVYLVIVLIYNAYLDHLDHQFGVHEEDDA